MSRKRQRKDLVMEDTDPALRDYNAVGVSTKRPRYDLRTGQVRECCSLPQYDKPPCQHKYHLRPFEHRKPTNHIVSSRPVHNIAAPQTGRRTCVKKLTGDLKRNAHSYSINGHITTRCSNSSTASGRQRVLEALKKGHSKGGSRQLKEEVSATICGLMICWSF
jgi:hypothetical protein